MSYHMLHWMIEDRANVNHFILRVLNFSLIDEIHYSQNISIPGDTNSYIFHKNKRDALSLSIVTLDKCNRISEMSNSVNLLPPYVCK